MSVLTGGTPAIAQGVAESLDPRAILEQISAAGITHVITVPDTHQRTLLEVLAQTPAHDLITVCTEDEAMGVNLGLFLGGARPLLLIQNSGFYAALNTIRGLSLDAKVPAILLIGEFSRNPEMPPAEHPSRLVHLLEPTLQTWKIPFHRLDHPEDLVVIPRAVEQAWTQRGPVALLVGAPTGPIA